jgi:hypothetical protein
MEKVIEAIPKAMALIASREKQIRGDWPIGPTGKIKELKTPVFPLNYFGVCDNFLGFTSLSTSDWG